MNIRLLILYLLRGINRDEEKAPTCRERSTISPELLSEYLSPFILYRYTLIFCTRAVQCMYINLTFKGLAENMSYRKLYNNALQTEKMKERVYIIKKIFKQTVDAPPAWTFDCATFRIGRLAKRKSNNVFLDGLVGHLLLLRCQVHSCLLRLFLHTLSSFKEN